MISTRRALLAACAASPFLAARPNWRMKLSTSSVLFRTLPVERAVARIASLGYEGIDFWPSKFQCTHLDEIATRLGGAGLKALLQKHKLRLSAFTMYSTEFERYAPLLGAAGGGLVIRESKYGKFEPGQLRVEMRAFMENLKPWLDLVERNNSYVAVENHSKALLCTVDSFRAFLDEARHPRLGLALAPYHLQEQAVPVESVIELVQSRLLFFYGWQEASGAQQLPGTGPADCRPWVQALSKVGFPGWVNPFMHGDQDEAPMARGLALAKTYLEKCARRG